MTALPIQGDRERLLVQACDGALSLPLAMQDMPQLVARSVPAAGEP